VTVQTVSICFRLFSTLSSPVGRGQRKVAGLSAVDISTLAASLRVVIVDRFHLQEPAVPREKDDD
jgi:hypothetical protein